MSEYDSPWKEALDLYFEPFMAFFFPLAHAEIDWNRNYEFLDKELQKIMPEAETGRRTVDKLVKVWRRSGEEEWLLIHVEVQSQYETDFAQRMYVYNYRIFDRYNRQVVSLAILGDEHVSWRPDSFGYQLWGCSVELRFPVIKLLDYGESWQLLETQDNPFAVMVLAHLKSLETRKNPEDRRSWKLRLARGLYERGLSAAQVRQLFRFIDWMMDLPRELELSLQEELAQLEEGKPMPYITSVERFAREKAFLKGIKVLLRVRFPEQASQLFAEIQPIQDHEKLEAILDAMETVESPEALRRLWQAPENGSK